MERPRQKGHGDYASNVALQLAKPAGLAAARPRRPGRRAAERPTGSRGSRSPVRVSSTSPSTPAPRARSPTTSSRRGRPTAAPMSSPASAGQRRVHLGQPDRPAPPRPALAGRRSAMRWRGVLAAAGCRGRAGVLLQRPRRPDGQVRRLAAGQGPRPGGAGGRLPRARTSRDLAPAVLAAHPGLLDLPDAEASMRSARRPTGSSSPQQESSRDFRVTFDVWFSERDAARRAGAVARRLERLRGAGPHLRRGRRGLDAHRPTSATTRTGS